MYNKSDGVGSNFGSTPYRSFVLFWLTLIYTLNFIDRILITVVSRPIIEEFSLSNLEFGLLTGIGFALFYTILGIPIARLSERYNRVKIISICVVLWSLATVLCGFTVGFVTLLVARMAVGIGEAGCTPPANSLICDYYKPSSRPKALGIYATGSLLGGAIAYLLGGVIINNFTWREAFIFIGTPGVIIGLVALFTIKEPPRGYSDPPGPTRHKTSSIKEAMAEILNRPTFWLTAIAMSLASFASYSLSSFKPLYIQYEFGISPGAAAINYLAPIAIAAAIGSFISGFVIQRFSMQSNLATIWIPAMALILCVPFWVLGFLAEDKISMLILFMLGAFVQYFFIGATLNVVQSVVSVRVRATAIAILLFIINLIGYGAGPPLIGVVADIFTAAKLEANNLIDVLSVNCSPKDPRLTLKLVSSCVEAKAYGARWSLIVAASISLLASLFYFLCLRTFNKDQKAASS